VLQYALWYVNHINHFGYMKDGFMEALEGLHSPRLIALQKSLTQESETQHFWQEIEAEGTPLVEQSGNDQFLVTLLWRDQQARKPSELTCSLGGILNSRGMAHRLFQLGNSDVWYRTYQLPANVRATYHFFVNHEPVSDSLSKRTFHVPSDEVSVFLDKEMHLGVVELPDAPPETPWLELKPDTPHGTLHSQLFSSSAAGHDYRLAVYTPSNYDPDNDPYPLLLLYDTWTYTEVISASTLLDNLIAAGAIPPLVAVLFGHLLRKDRMNEMGFYEPFFACVMQELLPYIQQHYATTSDPARSIVAGASMGGIAAMYTGLRHSERFGNIYSHTGSFHSGPLSERAYQRLEREIQQRAFVPQRFYLDVGMLERDEMGFGSPDGGPNAIQSNRFIRGVLRAKSYDVTYTEYPGGHDLLWAPATLAQALLDLTTPFL
jgi:enterochelin esterase family protein